MSVYRGVNDVASMLDMSPSTVKKYYLLIEDKGYRFRRNQQGQVMFGDHDVQLFKQIIILKNEPGMSVHKAVEKITSAITDITIYSPPEEPLDTTDMTVMIKQMEEMQKAMNLQNNILLKVQNELNELKEEQKFSRKLIESNKIETNNKELDYKGMVEETNRMMKEVMEMFAASKDKKGFWSRLLKKS